MSPSSAASCSRHWPAIRTWRTRQPPADALPWDNPLTTLKTDITGPVAFTISLPRHGGVWRGARVRRRDQRVHPPPHHDRAGGRVPRRRDQPGLGAGDYRSNCLSLRRTPFFRVLHRPRLFLGGEREPTLMMAIVAAGPCGQWAEFRRRWSLPRSSGSAASASSARLRRRSADEPGLHASDQVSRLLRPALATLSGYGEVISRLYVGMMIAPPP